MMSKYSNRGIILNVCKKRYRHLIRNSFPVLVVLVLSIPVPGTAQTGNRQYKIDSLKKVIETQKDSLPALRQYLSLFSLPNDTVTTQFDAWMKQFPKVVTFPYALGEAFYKRKDRKSVGYFIKAFQMGANDDHLSRMFSIAMDEKWEVDVARTANTVDSLKRVIENNPDSILPLQQYMFVLGKTNDTAVLQMESWIKKFPKSASFPFVIGESYSGAESPKAKPYLLKVVALQPGNAKVWEMLAIDAERWGDNAGSLEYMGKAAAADPQEPSYSFYYAMSFEAIDTAVWSKKLWELAAKFPESERGAQGLYWLGERSQSTSEKQHVFEQLRKLYPPAKFDWSAGGMSSLYDLYLQTGQTDKAIELAGSLKSLEGFPAKLELAKNVASVRSLIKQHKYQEAKKSIVHIKAPRYSSTANMILLLKAEVTDAAGAPQGAYDSLLIIQAKTPDEAIMNAVVKYGAKLGKNKTQIEKDLWALRDKASRPAPAFDLAMYTSAGRSKLEDYRGKVVLLTFWFPGCGPCRGEMVHFQKVVDKFNKKDLAYVGINVSPEQDEYVLPFMEGTKYSFIPLRDNDKWAEKAYHVRGEPTNFLIDQEGKIVYADFMINGNNEHMLELMIHSMLTKNIK